MDYKKTGSLIKALRKENGLTQEKLAQILDISDRAVSKWERGLGLPDISIMPKLSQLFGVNIEKLLEGQILQNLQDSGNLKNIKFYICPTCGNILTTTGKAEIYCCGKRLKSLAVKPAEGAHSLKVEDCGDELYISFSHEMSKEHHLNFIALVGSDRYHFIRLYPEQAGELYVAKLYSYRIFFGCNKHGLWTQAKK